MITVKKWVHKPEVMETVKLTESNIREVGEWFNAKEIIVTYGGDETRVRFTYEQLGMDRSFHALVGETIYKRGKGERTEVNVIHPELKKAYSRA